MSKRIQYKVHRGMYGVHIVTTFDSLIAALSFVARKRAKWLADNDIADFKITKEHYRIALGGLIKDETVITRGKLLNRHQNEYMGLYA